MHTGIRKRDDHLRSADFFDVEKFPDISVVVTNAERDRRRRRRAACTTHHQGHDETAAAARPNVAVLDDGAVRLTTQATVDRQDFGVDGNLIGMVGDKATISGDVVFRRAR